MYYLLELVHPPTEFTFQNAAKYSMNIRTKSIKSIYFDSSIVKQFLMILIDKDLFSFTLKNSCV